MSSLRGAVASRGPRIESVTSRENAWLKRFRAALRLGKLEEENLIGIEGARLVEDALASGLDPAAVLLSDSAAPLLDRIVAHFADASPAPRILRVSDRLFASVSGTETPQGVAALVPPRGWRFEDLLRGDTPLVVVLVGVQDPGNVGTILRSAEAFGATGAMLAAGTAHATSPKVLRASAGSALRLPCLAGHSAPVALAQLKIAGLRLVAATAHPDPALRACAPSEFNLREPAALLVGNEGSGLPREVERSADALIRIPLAGPAESLNAAVAASVLLYEAARQRAVAAEARR